MMNTDSRRITLICRGANAPERGWRTDSDSTTRNILLHAFSVLTYALHTGLSDLEQDVERVVIDHAAGAPGFLELLATLPANFSGDILFVDARNRYLSATGRGGGRVLYALSEVDVEFYFETHALTREYAVPLLRIA